MGFEILKPKKVHLSIIKQGCEFLMEPSKPIKHFLIFENAYYFAAMFSMSAFPHYKSGCKI